jgi:hypothetical protein
VAVSDVLTIAKLSRWSISYYTDTANAVGQAVKDARKAGGGLGEYYTEHDTRTPVWLCARDTHTAATLVGLSDLPVASWIGRVRDAVAMSASRPSLVTESASSTIDPDG